MVFRIMLYYVVRTADVLDTTTFTRTESGTKLTLAMKEL